MEAPKTNQTFATSVANSPVLKVGDKVITVDRNGNPVTITVTHVPPTGNRHERRKALKIARRIQKA